MEWTANGKSVPDIYPTATAAEAETLQNEIDPSYVRYAIPVLNRPRSSFAGPLIAAMLKV